MTTDTQPTPPTVLAYALAYAAHGWPVLPLKPGSKAPATEHGFKDATTDEALIRARYEAMPGAGVGIHPGPGGLLVLDVDVKDNALGAESLEALQNTHQPLPATLRQKTPSGGFHLFLRLDGPGTIGNRELAPGIDVRCAAGYVVAEPTRVTLNAGREAGYAFDDWDVLAGEVPEIAPAPSWLLALLVDGATRRDVFGPEGGGAGRAVEARTVATLRSALNFLDADDYKTWIDNGQRLRELGWVGRELWLTWSQQSPRYNPAEAAAKWASFTGDRSGYAGVFKAAQLLGWTNPARKLADAQHAHQDPATPGTDLDAPLFVEVPFDDLAHTVPPAPVYWWEGLIPARVVTLLAAHGGTGKSTIALMLAVCIALGLALFGIPTRRGIVAFYSAEDPASLIRYRLAQVCGQLAVSVTDLVGRLILLDASDGDPALFQEVTTEGRRQGATTPAYLALHEFVEAKRIDVLIVDNASDTFDASEIDRARVRGYMRALARIARTRDGAVLLLAHVDKGTSRGDRGNHSEGYSGSTAWHNSSRSRLFLSRNDSKDRLLLEHQKNNLGPAREPLTLEWPPNALPRAVTVHAGPVEGMTDQKAVGALLRLIDEYTVRGEFVSTATTSRTHAAKLLSREPTCPRVDKGQLFALLRWAEREGLLARKAYSGPDRKPRERWQVTPAGCEFADIAATAATAATLEVTAPTAADAAPAATAATSPGGVGERARTEVAAEICDEVAR